MGPRQLRTGICDGTLVTPKLLLLAVVSFVVDARPCARAPRGLTRIAVVFHFWTFLVLLINRLRWVLGGMRSTLHLLSSVLGSFFVIVLGWLTVVSYVAMLAT